MKNNVRQILNIAWPLTISGFSTALLQLADTVFLARFDEQVMAAAGNAALFYFFVVYSLAGLSNGIQIIMSRRLGENKPQEIPEYFQHGFAVLLVLAICIIIFVLFFFKVMAFHLNSSDFIAGQSVLFIRYRIWGLLPVVVSMLFHSFYTAIQKTKIISIATTISVGLNIILDYIFIFGFGHWKGWGLQGAAIASVLSEIAGLILLWTFYRKFFSEKYPWYRKFRYKWTCFKTIFNVSLPLIMQGSVAMGAWYLFFNFVEHIDWKSLAVSHIVRSLYMFFMIPVFSISIAVNTLTANLSGSGDLSKISSILRSALNLSWVWNILSIIVLLFGGEFIVSQYTTIPELIEMTKPVLWVIGGAFFIFSVSTNFYQAIAGLGYTKQAFFIELISILIYITSAWIIIFRLGGNVTHAWMSEWIYFGIFAALCFYFLKKIRWQPKKI